MHPLIRILLFLICAALVPMAGADGLLLGAALLAGLWWAAGVPFDGAAWQAVRRLRWLALSLALMSAWTTPGHLLWPAWGDYSPTAQGVLLGLQRAALLVLLGLGAHLLMRSTPRARLVAALALLQPRDSRFALRLILTLEAVGSAQERLQGVLRQPPRARLAALRATLTAAEAGELAPAGAAGEAVAWPRPGQWGWLLLALPMLALVGGR